MSICLLVSVDLLFCFRLIKYISLWDPGYGLQWTVWICGNWSVGQTSSQGGTLCGMFWRVLWVLNAQNNPIIQRSTVYHFRWIYLSLDCYLFSRSSYENFSIPGGAPPLDFFVNLWTRELCGWITGSGTRWAWVVTSLPPFTICGTWIHYLTSLRLSFSIKWG